MEARREGVAIAWLMTGVALIPKLITMIMRRRWTRTATMTIGCAGSIVCSNHQKDDSDFVWKRRCGSGSADAADAAAIIIAETFLL